jgi:hypothetical protein
VVRVLFSAGGQGILVALDTSMMQQDKGLGRCRARGCMRRVGIVAQLVPVDVLFCD